MGSFFSEEHERRRTLMETLFREHWTSVHRYISSKVRQPDVADDLASLVFLKAFRWLLEDRGMGQVHTWLYATARTRIADYWQEQHKKPSLPLQSIKGSVAGPVDQQDEGQAQERVQPLLHGFVVRRRQVRFLASFQR